MVSFTTKDGKKVNFEPKAKKKKPTEAPAVPKAPAKPKKKPRKNTGKGIKGVGMVMDDGKNKGGIPNKKLKCFMRKAGNGGVYRTCVVPEKAKKPKMQVRGKPRGAGKGGEKAITPAMKEKRKADAKKARATANPKRQTITKADGSVVVVKKKTKAELAKAKKKLKDKQKKAKQKKEKRSATPIMK